MPASFTSTASSSMSNKEEGASASTTSARSLETAQPTVPILRPQPEPETK